MSVWRIVFMGTPRFAGPILEALLGRADPVVGVVCQPDRPRGRGLLTAPPAIKEIAIARGLPVLQPERLRDASFASALRALAPDLIVVAAYGKILPPAILAIPPRGCLNVHASLLPRHRGAAPIPRAILAGDTVTGVTVMVMNEEMDAGDILMRRETPIAADDTGGTLADRLAHLGAGAIGEALDGLARGTLRDRLAHLGAGAIGEALDGLARGTLRAIPQPADEATFAPRIERDQCRLEWQRPAVELERQVRALAPEPSAFTQLAGRVLKVHRAAVERELPSEAPTGQIIRAGPDGILVTTGAGGLRLLEVQLEGRRRLSADRFLAGHRLPPGTCLGE
ncbi:MAG: methionyl-tRNA formyltransferase [Deltaproteobacteria bacterium]|nr:MAG: methionyl-tRNA formyltransferase [Deltaproteobacteria bacterium]